MTPNPDGLGVSCFAVNLTGGFDHEELWPISLLSPVSASRAFNLKRVHSYAEYSRFVDTVKVIVNHTYAVLLNESDKRGLFIFKVVDYIPNEKVVLRYAVKSYELMPNGQIRSAGFDWDKTNN